MKKENELNPFDAKRLLADVMSAGQNTERQAPPPAADTESMSPSSLAVFYAARKRDAHRLWSESCPDGLHESDWTHPDLGARNRDAIQRVLAHTPGPKGLLCAGPTGLGKSRAMWSLMRRLSCEEARVARYWTAADWFSTLEDQIHFGRDSARGWVDAVAKQPIVLIDDLGQQPVLASRQDWSMSWFLRFLDIRVGERLPLYATTNLSVEELACRGASTIRSDPLVRRLLDLCEVVKFEA
jgi:DNA replication protein DnaC